MSAFISFQSVSKRYGDVRVIDGLDFQINRGEFISLLGPSGSGKTTMLMLLAGFEAPSGGQILIDGKRVDHLPPHARNMGVVFQNYALFPHMSIADNIAFPLKMRGLSKAELKAKVARALDMVQLGSAAARKPAQLSGGQQQRIALARALVFEPEVVLMDEPLGALDKQLREHMQLELRELHRSLGFTVMFVTHDQSEAITLSDRIAVFNAGRIEQIDTPEAIYARPETRFVAQFIGETNLLEGTVTDSTGQASLITLAGGIPVRSKGCRTYHKGVPVLVSVRPESLRLGVAPEGANPVRAIIEDLVYQGDHVRAHLKAGGMRLVSRVRGVAHAYRKGQEVDAYFVPDECAVLPR